MRLLLDTHIFLWYISGDSRLPPTLRTTIQDSANEVFLSVASVWEACIKHHLGKLPLPETPGTYLPEQRQRHLVASLPIEERALRHLAGLPPLHRDPFDRVLICQAIEGAMTLVTMDEAVRVYPIAVLPER